MRYRNLINDDEYIAERNILQSSITHIKEQLRQTEDRTVDWLKLTDDVFDFACHAQAKFNGGSIETKKEIFSALGTSFSLKDNVLTIEMNKYFEPVLMGYKELESMYKSSAPEKFGESPMKLSSKQKIHLQEKMHLLWGDRRESNPRNRCHRAVFYH